MHVKNQIIAELIAYFFYNNEVGKIFWEHL